MKNMKFNFEKLLNKYRYNIDFNTVSIPKGNKDLFWEQWFVWYFTPQQIPIYEHYNKDSGDHWGSIIGWSNATVSINPKIKDDMEKDIILLDGVQLKIYEIETDKIQLLNISTPFS